MVELNMGEKEATVVRSAIETQLQSLVDSPNSSSEAIAILAEIAEELDNQLYGGAKRLCMLCGTSAQGMQNLCAECYDDMAQEQERREREERNCRG